MLRFLWKGITKIITWSVRKIRGGIKQIDQALRKFDLNINQASVMQTVSETVTEVDMTGKYNDLDFFAPIPLEKIVESTENLRRNYMTKMEVYYHIRGIDEPFSEILSVSHDEPLSHGDLEERIQPFLDKYPQEMGREDAQLLGSRILIVKHKKGAPLAS